MTKILSAWRSLAASFGQLLHSWWWQDRIRVNKSCGQLLTLAVGHRLLIKDDVFRIYHADRITPEPDVAHTTAVDDWATEVDMHDEKSSAAAPLHVVYLLRSCGVGDEAQWHTLDDEMSFSIAQERVDSEATMIVPVALPETIWFIQGENQQELLAEEITVLPLDSPSALCGMLQGDAFKLAAFGGREKGVRSLFFAYTLSIK